MLYKASTALLHAYANLANEMAEAGYMLAKFEQIRQEVEHYEMFEGR